MTKRLKNLSMTGLASGCVLLASHLAQAMNGLSNIQIDGGPLGPLEISGGMDGYFYAQSGAKTGYNSTATDVDDFMLQLEKPPVRSGSSWPAIRL